MAPSLGARLGRSGPLGFYRAMSQEGVIT
jgi:hypothetical protein